MINKNWLQPKNGGKHKLSVNFSYVVTIYQLWNNGITLNALFTPCVINIFLIKYKQKYPTHQLRNMSAFCPCIFKNKLPCHVQTCVHVNFQVIFKNIFLKIVINEFFMYQKHIANNNWLQLKNGGKCRLGTNF